MALLENELGSQLLVRTTRSQQLTEAGEQLFIACKPHLEALKSAEASISDFAILPKGKLKILLPLEFFNQIMAELISEFAMLYPDVSINCQHYSEEIPEQDLSFDLIFVLHDQTLPASNWIAKTLLSFPQAIYCAATSFQPEKRTPEELIERQCILSQENQLWLFRGDNNTTVIEPNAFMVLSSP